MRVLSTIKCGELVERLQSLHHTAREAGLRQWLQRELEGYQEMDSLPWYRVVECRQRGLFLHVASGRQRTCQIHEEALCQRHLNVVKFLQARGPLSDYLDCHALVLERWPDELLQAYSQLLIPEHLCLHAWKEPVLPVKEQLLHGVESMLKEYLPGMENEMRECGRSLRAIHHRHWRI